MFNIYWLPLLHKGIFTGRALPLPLLSSPPIATIIVSPSSSLPLPLSHSPAPASSPYLLKLSGRINGVAKARKLSFRTAGTLKPQTLTSNFGYYNRQIFTKWGTIGLKILGGTL